ncbi:bacteriophage abortive infection AbiH family protein [Luteibacter flocculans]|uniref:Bacteriophage abortive infection AbiH family protein n=1 Tax=Luteibacter flocculans TaxID=2780091 RepID=A0ABY4T4N7_9GAMM|nr:bacteriophage abortive infection AbiH family protein [Luteibacter flocculans]URL59864.1 bacteriophage abortive infection AbiH family protein [Luteibacter flocculans]
MTLLYVIGNGFDLHHRMSSSYDHFREYLKRHHRDIYRLVEEYFPAFEDDFWSHFEERLADFNAETLVENSEHLVVSYGAKDWSDSYHHDYAYELEKVVEAISEGLLTAFTQWVRTIVIPPMSSLMVPRARIDPSARFINFNYTSTLQLLYGVPESQVWHIHGSATSSEPLVLGHAWKPWLNETWSARVDSEDTDTRVIDGARILDEYFQTSFKDTASIIASNTRRFAALADVSEIRVLGHSLGKVDQPYFAKIAACVPQNVRWRISYFDGLDDLKTNFEQFAPLNPATFLQLPEV